nr:MAG TPA: hypothetical protein [Caudoviricetes sp.]
MRRLMRSEAEVAWELSAEPNPHTGYQHRPPQTNPLPGTLRPESRHCHALIFPACRRVFFRASHAPHKNVEPFTLK